MPEERRLTIGSTARLSPDEVARRTFGTARRGFDTAEVRAYLDSLARELQVALARENDLLEALADAQHLAANPVLDEATLTSALGQETAKVLRSAHDAAAELLARAESDATRLRSQAEEESDQMRARAEQHAAERGSQVEAAATEVRHRLQEEETSRLESAKLEAEALVSQARAECRAMVHEAQELRARVLSDLTRRRRTLHSQIEQLRAGRDRLAETIGDVRHTVDRVTDDLFRAEDEARLAAEAAGRQVAAHDEVDDALDQLPTAAGDEPDHDGDEVRRQQAVEDLFARLRAEQVPDPAEGVTVLGVIPAAGAGTTPASSATSEAGTTALAVAEDERRGTPEPEPVADRVVDPVMARRDELLGAALAALCRRLKRVLADDQNGILDRLRGVAGWSAEVLGSQEDHEGRYREAAQGPLGEAARAGALFGGGSADDAPAVGAIADDLARSIVAPLRRRLLDHPGSADDRDEAAMVEHVGSAFREWKGQRVERVAADHAHDAFWEGAMVVTPADQPLRWVVDDDGVQCPDCDDNALAGSLAPGEQFPTGHMHPPAHPGCRCLLVPGPA